MWLHCSEQKTCLFQGFSLSITAWINIGANFGECTVGLEQKYYRIEKAKRDLKFNKDPFCSHLFKCHPQCTTHLWSPPRLSSDLSSISSFLFLRWILHFPICCPTCWCSGGRGGTVGLVFCWLCNNHFTKKIMQLNSKGRSGSGGNIYRSIPGWRGPRNKSFYKFPVL